MSKYGLLGWTQMLSLAMHRATASRGDDGPGALRRAWRRLVFWQYRANMRHDLRHMPEYLLRDIGITREQALMEGQRPFWRD